MNDPLPIWCIVIKRNTMLAHTADGPIVFVNEAEAFEGIEKIARQFKLATLLSTFYDEKNAARYAGWDWEKSNDHRLPAGAITLRYLKNNEAKIREEIAAGKGPKVVAKKSTRTKKGRRTATLRKKIKRAQGKTATV